VSVLLPHQVGTLTPPWVHGQDDQLVCADQPGQLTHRPGTVEIAHWEISGGEDSRVATLITLPWPELTREDAVVTDHRFRVGTDPKRVAIRLAYHTSGGNPTVPHSRAVRVLAPQLGEQRDQGTVIHAPAGDDPVAVHNGEPIAVRIILGAGFYLVLIRHSARRHEY
jgi:hypothetical protein